jgi:hypothetical protein
MAKSGMTSDREATARNAALSKRPCVFEGCKGTMELAVTFPKRKTIWACRSCGRDIPKIPQDWYGEQA